MGFANGMESGASKDATTIATPNRGEIAPGKQPSAPLWKRALRVLLFLLFLAVGSVAAGGRPRNGVYYSNTSEVVQALIEGALIGLLLLAIVGSVGHLIARRRGWRRSWRTSATTFPALLVTLVLLVLSAAGRGTQQREAIAKATPDPTGSLVQRQKANLDAQAWSQSRATVERAIVATFAQHRAFVKLFGADGNTSAVRQIATRIGRAFAREQADWRALPRAPLADMQQLDGQVISALGAAASAYSDYDAGLRANVASGLPLVHDKSALALLDRGDAKLKIAERRLRAFETQLRVLDQRYSIR